MALYAFSNAIWVVVKAEVAVTALTIASIELREKNTHASTAAKVGAIAVGLIYYAGLIFSSVFIASPFVSISGLVLGTLLEPVVGKILVNLGVVMKLPVCLELHETNPDANYVAVFTEYYR